MASLRWVADGIEVAEAAGGVTLELYRRPGFTAELGVRQRSTSSFSVSGFEIELDPGPDDEEDPGG